jgi:SAM-dependent methyltransferase
MSLTPELVGWLQSEQAQPWLHQLTDHPPDDSSLLPTLTRLRKHFTSAQASALVRTAQLRKRAFKKFGDQAHEMFFSEKALQQATPSAVAAYTARRYGDFAWVVDVGCGLGGDALALAAIGRKVLAIDLDPLALALLRANVLALGLTSNIFPLRADVRRPAWRVSAAWADPGRRTDRQRIFHPQALHPPLSEILRLQRQQMPHLGVKLMPGLRHELIPPQAEAEWISLAGELKEVVLWFGHLRRSVGRRATVLPAGVSLWAQGAQTHVQLPGNFLYEPDPAVIRAGAVADLAQRLNLWQIDSEIAYLSGPALLKTPFARSWRIIEHFAFDLKQLNRHLRALHARVVAVKKRSSPIEPEPFRRRLHSAPGGRPVIVVLTRVRNHPWMLICTEANSSDA